LADEGIGTDRTVSVSLELKRNERLRSPDAQHAHLLREQKRIRGKAVVFVDELQMALPERAKAEERKRAETALYGSLNELKSRNSARRDSAIMGAMLGLAVAQSAVGIPANKIERTA